MFAFTLPGLPAIGVGSTDLSPTIRSPELSSLPSWQPRQFLPSRNLDAPLCSAWVSTVSHDICAGYSRVMSLPCTLDQSTAFAVPAKPQAAAITATARGFFVQVMD